MFQLTTSRRGRRISGDNFINLCFNSRPHEEVDLSLSIAKDFLDVSTHDLTKRSTLQRFHRFFSGGYFNSRPHEEVDLWHRALGNQCNCFNSRPHEEVDDGWICDNSVFILVSTHDLTKRSTIMMKIPIITWTFQLTTSRRGRLFLPAVSPARFVFQLTTSRRGRLLST